MLAGTTYSISPTAENELSVVMLHAATDRQMDVRDQLSLSLSLSIYIIRDRQSYNTGTTILYRTYFDDIIVYMVDTVGVAPVVSTSVAT
jgi:hypothetical protein